MFKFPTLNGYPTKIKHHKLKDKTLLMLNKIQNSQNRKLAWLDVMNLVSETIWNRRQSIWPSKEKILIMFCPVTFNRSSAELLDSTIKEEGIGFLLILMVWWELIISPHQALVEVELKLINKYGTFTII